MPQRPAAAPPAPAAQQPVPHPVGTRAAAVEPALQPCTRRGGEEPALNVAATSAPPAPRPVLQPVRTPPAAVELAYDSSEDRLFGSQVAASRSPSALRIKARTLQQPQPNPAGAATHAAGPRSEPDSAATSWHFGVLYPWLRHSEQLAPPQGARSSHPLVDRFDACRRSAVEMLVSVHAAEGLRPETLHLATSLIDRYLAKARAELAEAELASLNLRLFAMAIFLIASKFEEGIIWDYADMLDVVGGDVTVEDLHRMEVALLQKLDYRLHFPLALHHLSCFLKVAGASQDQCCVAEYVCEVGLLSPDLPSWQPSEHAAASIVLSSRIQGVPDWPAKFEECCGAAESQARREGILRVLATLRRAVRQAGEGNEVYAKFSADRYQGLAPRIAKRVAEVCRTSPPDGPSKKKRRVLWRRHALAPEATASTVELVQREAIAVGSGSTGHQPDGPSRGSEGRALVPVGQGLCHASQACPQAAGLPGPAIEPVSTAGPPAAPAPDALPGTMLAPQRGPQSPALPGIPQGETSYPGSYSGTVTQHSGTKAQHAEAVESGSDLNIPLDRPVANVQLPPLGQWSEDDRSWYWEVLHPVLCQGEDMSPGLRGVCQKECPWVSSRARLVDLVIHHHFSFRFRPATLHLAVQLIDRCLAHLQIQRSCPLSKLRRLNLLASTLLCIAAKFEDEAAPDFRCLAKNSQGEFEERDVHATELWALAHLDFRLHGPLAVHHLPGLLDLAGAGREQCAIAGYVCEAGLSHPELPAWRPSDHAAAAVTLAALLARAPMWPPALAAHFHIWSDIERVVAIHQVFHSLVGIIGELSQGVAVFDKYSTEIYDSLAKTVASRIDALLKSASSDLSPQAFGLPD